MCRKSDKERVGESECGREGKRKGRGEGKRECGREGGRVRQGVGDEQRRTRARTGGEGGGTQAPGSDAGRHFSLGIGPTSPGAGPAHGPELGPATPVPVPWKRRCGHGGGRAGLEADEGRVSLVVVGHGIRVHRLVGEAELLQEDGGRLALLRGGRGSEF